MKAFYLDKSYFNVWDSIALCLVMNPNHILLCDTKITLCLMMNPMIMWIKICLLSPSCMCCGCLFNRVMSHFVVIHLLYTMLVVIHLFYSEDYCCYLQYYYGTLFLICSTPPHSHSCYPGPMHCPWSSLQLFKIMPNNTVAGAHCKKHEHSSSYGFWSKAPYSPPSTR